MNTICSVVGFGVLLLVLIEEARSRSTGPPVGDSPSICQTLRPDHPSDSVSISDLPGGFFIFSELLDNSNNGAYQAGTTYDVSLSNADETQFRGFMIQARQRGTTNLIGTFTILDSTNTQTLTCSSNTASTVAHRNGNDKTRVSFEWTAPAGSDGSVEFRYTVVTAYRSDFYLNLNAEDHRPPGCAFSPTDSGDFTFEFGIPEGCSGSSCNYFVAMAQNEDQPDYLDVHLTGMTMGWIAIGFSMNQLMEEDDVLGCRADTTDSSVDVIDTWNPSGRRNPNVLDTTQTDICTHSASFSDGRISCTFSRLINGSNAGQDYYLNDTFYLFYGRRTTAQTSGAGLASHTVDNMNPPISTMAFNPVLDEFSNVAVPNITCPPAPGDDAEYTFQFNNPGDDLFMAARVNPSNPLYIDIRLEGATDGWVGVGFSDNRLMENDDVLGCIRDSDNDETVFVIDTYNPNGRRDPNRRDPNQDDTCTHVAEFADGRISCTFSRLINGSEIAEGFDKDLSQDWFLLFGTSSDRGSRAGSLPQHSTTPLISESRANIAEDESTALSDFPRTELLKVHGILMVITWPLLVVTAIFFAAWMKPALPNGEWFQMHRVFMIVALIVASVGFIFAFVANADNATPGLISFACNENTAHFVIGIIVFILQIANPIIALVRCNPTSKNRWIFNLTHGTLIGFIAELLALANVGIGIALFEAQGCNVLEASEYTILWVYIGFVIFLLIAQVVLFIVFTVVAFLAEPEKRAGLAPSMLKYLFALSGTSQSNKPEKPIEMTDPAKPDKPAGPPPRKPPSQDAPLRWIGLAVVLPVTLILMLTVIILIIVQ